MPNKKNNGFTLLELMVALTLGLLIVAAGLAVFIGGQRSFALQGGMNELQQNANFGLAILTHDLRMTNLNTPSTQKVNNKQVGSGVIFVGGNLPSSLSGKVDGLLTAQGVDGDATAGKSDQLTIQYVPFKVTQKDCKKDTADKDGNCTDENKEDVIHYKTVDCEGNNIDFTEPRTIVQRYHLKPDTNQITGQPKAYSLYCDAGDYKDGDTVITGMASATANGQQLMQRIDAFKVRLEVKGPDKKLRYMTIKEYTDLMSSITDEKQYYNVIGVEIGLLARSTSPLNSEKLIDNTKPFEIIGNKISLNDDQQKGSKFLREVFSQAISFRNTLGASE
ncbi:PilW family protein [Acinetobacter ursingii]|uniref:PilW family protein n=1 Tax=Acinetobacter ursingii TaxID=108980 RepID=UPI0022EA92EB|nr:PilW family protein [Acinetobacter ursingii]MDA3579929.1 PilW family protein [Acinetobacter ursingii]MDG9949681.1 PilW family protein [Acinetobacter ursingii]MDH0809200.1 PilW family protein [Acinetobacter ursingii]MDH2019476.1 PilW family protein [Acinetobacter ursingii]MDH2071262.1 PilW family protein [Acinetobacter ursingii]